MTAFSIKIEGIAELTRRLSDPALIGAPLRRAFHKVGYVVEGAAKIGAPVDRGRLRASITSEMDSAAVPKWVQIGTNVEYAPYVHEGRPPGKFPPMDKIAAWAARKGLPAFPVARAIARNGTKPRPFLTDALDESERRIRNIFDAMIKEVGNG